MASNYSKKSVQLSLAVRGEGGITRLSRRKFKLKHGGAFGFFSTLRFLKLTGEFREGVHLGHLYHLVACHPQVHSKRLFPADHSRPALSYDSKYCQLTHMTQYRLPTPPVRVLKSSEMSSGSQSSLPSIPSLLCTLKISVNIAYLTV